MAGHPAPTPPRAHRAWWSWLLLLFVLVGTAGANGEETHDVGVVALALLVALPAVLPLVLQADARWSLGLSGLATAAYFAAGFTNGPIFFAFPGVVLLVAMRAATRTWVAWAAGFGCLIVASMIGRAIGYDLELVPSLWQAFGFVALGCAAGALGAVARSRQEARAEREQRTATEEQLRMAQELHDGVGHGLSVIAMQAGAALHVFDRDPAKARASLEAIRDTSRESLAALRAELAAMSGDAAPRRPAPGLAELPALVDRVRSAGLALVVEGTAGVVPERIGEAAYAVVQEALTNVLRHAGAERATVAFERTDGALTVTVTDDGRGADQQVAATGLGLDGMRSRVQRIGGAFEAGPAEAGFRVRVALPLEEEVR